MYKPRRLWPVVTAILIGLPVLYVGSYGPACWLDIHYDSPVMLPYVPLGMLYHDSRGAVRDAMHWWMTVGVRGRSRVFVPVSFDGTRVMVIPVNAMGRVSP